MSQPESPGPTYCPTCGERLIGRRVEGRERAYCRGCDAPVYRNPKPTAGVIVVDGDAVLLVRRTNPPAVGSWSLPAGFQEVDEPPAAAAVRELREETGVVVDPGALVLHDTAFGRRDDGSSVVTICYAVPRAATEGEPVAGDDAGDARFWTLDALAAAGERIEPGYRERFATAVRRFEG